MVVGMDVSTPFDLRDRVAVVTGAAALEALASQR